MDYIIKFILCFGSRCARIFFISFASVTRRMCFFFELLGECVLCVVIYLYFYFILMC